MSIFGSYTPNRLFMTHLHQMHRFCVECGTTLRGREDKKFCDDHCRSTYNNRLNRSAYQNARSIDRKLKRNYRILQNLGVPSAEIECDKLRELGFEFQIFTSIGTNFDGVELRHVYDLKYQFVSESSILFL
ncbi:MAG: hypothetical protein CFE24_05995 [Flavobacterium sp. BFFFF2]|nr:MAG: hypothetical protein CFE24_05995 [Flavobacterium sp. BFFFF2]